MNPYGEDLAYIHDVGHGEFAKAAAQQVVEELHAARVFTGTVVDLGCGSGILARKVTEAGYSVVGIDISESMIDLARRRSPTSTFRKGSFISAEFPECVAVTAIGEVLNYRLDERNDVAGRENLFRRISDALVPGGLLLFDVAGLERASSAANCRAWAQGEDWALLVDLVVDHANRLLTRNITSFRKVGESYRRQSETHRLALLEPKEVLDALNSVGFEASTVASYGNHSLPVGLVGFRGRKL